MGGGLGGGAATGDIGGACLWEDPPVVEGDTVGGRGGGAR